MSNQFVIDWEKYAATARLAASEGAVLLKNDHDALPLQKGIRLSVFGRSQFNYYKSGTGSGGMVNTRYVVSILDALKEEKGITLNAELEQVYTRWLEDHPFAIGKGWGREPWSQEEMPLEDAVIRQAAENSDTALIVIGRTAGEDRDAGNEEGSYLLTSLEEDMLRRVCAAFDRAIVVMNTGAIMDMKWVGKYAPSAVMYVWQGGMEG